MSSLKYFKIEIIEWCKNRENLIQREKEIITEEYVNDINCYNMKPGGSGGFNNPKHQFKCSQAAGLKHSKKLKTDEKYRIKRSQQMSDANKKGHKNGVRKSIQEYYNWEGKKHNQDTIEKMQNSKKGQGVGKSNSQYGTKWITNGSENKKIKKEDTLPDGWVYGVMKLKSV